MVRYEGKKNTKGRFSMTTHKFFDSVRIKYFRLYHKPFLRFFFPWLIFISDAFSLMLISRLSRIRWLICSLTWTYYSRWPTRSLIIGARTTSVDFSNPFMYFPPTHRVTAILKCHSSVNFTIFTPSDHKMSRSPLFLVAFNEWNSHVSQYCSKRRRPAAWTLRKSRTSHIRHFVSIPTKLLWRCRLPRLQTDVQF
jgi:hypothetical protein